jgi:hypothetical protein
LLAPAPRPRAFPYAGLHSSVVFENLMVTFGGAPDQTGYFISPITPTNELAVLTRFPNGDLSWKRPTVTGAKPPVRANHCAVSIGESG